MTERRSEQEILDQAKAAHDRVCSCDPRYLMSCPRMAQAILGTARR
jgi:PadR family transcriptional regulator